MGVVLVVVVVAVVGVHELLAVNINWNVEFINVHGTAASGQRATSHRHSFKRPQAHRVAYRFTVVRRVRLWINAPTRAGASCTYIARAHIKRIYCMFSAGTGCTQVTTR